MDGISLKTLSDGIITACREKAEDMPRFSDGDGAIRITFLPQSALGYQLQQANSELATRYEVATKFSDGGNFVVNRTTKPVDTYSRTAMKIAHICVSKKARKTVAPKTASGQPTACSHSSCCLTTKSSACCSCA